MMQSHRCCVGVVFKGFLGVHQGPCLQDATAGRKVEFVEEAPKASTRVLKLPSWMLFPRLLDFKCFKAHQSSSKPHELQKQHHYKTLCLADLKTILPSLCCQIFACGLKEVPLARQEMPKRSWLGGEGVQWAETFLYLELFGLPF